MRRLSPPMLGTLAVLGLHILSSCRTTTPAAYQDHPNDFPQSLSARLLPKNKDYFIRLIDSANHAVLDVETSACQDSKRKNANYPLPVRIVVQSPFAVHNILAEVPRTSTATTRMSATVDGRTASFLAPQGMADIWTKSFFAGICAAAKADEELAAYRVEAPEQVEALRNLATFVATRVAPDCEFHAPESADVSAGLACSLPELDDQAAEQELEHVRHTMITSWSRQPYLLARRVSVASQLAEAITRVRESNGDFKSLDRICRMISHSLNYELPAVLDSKRWQQGACAKDSHFRMEAATIGLAKAVAEIDFLRRLFESSSRLGTVQVRLTGLTPPTSLVLLSLKPATDVTSNILKESEFLWDKMEKRGRKPEKSGQRWDRVAISPPRACWHPLFSESAPLMAIARQMDLAGGLAGLECQGPADGSDEGVGDATERYLAESVTSDTEFPLNNGQAKMLRLPPGSYKYSVLVLPENPLDWDDASRAQPAQAGQITWDVRRPRVAIRTELAH